ncbi:MAG: hypothetical protein QOF61_2910, partial [Acidobacteriota bacterium]|nr:hypothetical protein [Acidobacteriota bacterium]
VGHPVCSMISDFKMVALMLIGQLKQK